ncbi:MAG: alpha/beta hydrolase [Anaerolineae bacterium]|nr:alpha/beta hydrolase [Anaerolineae bacterium]
MIKFVLWMIIGMLLSVSAVSAQAATDAFEFESTNCPFTVPEDLTVECGYLIVPEDRNGDLTDTIRLAVALYRSTSSEPAPDPVVFLQGGPGGGSIELLAGQIENFVRPILAERDLLVYDQRGTGLSQPALSCDGYLDLYIQDLELNLNPEEYAQANLEMFADCRAQLEADLGVNTAAYTSAASAADIRDLAAHFGYEQVNLYGGSYGTRLAQTVARDFPEIVRSMVLDGVIPVELNLYEQQSAKTKLALDALFAACSADVGCDTAFPNLEQVFYDTYAQLDVTPGELTITNPLTGDSYTVPIDGLTFMSGMFFALQTSQLIPTLPQTIYAVSEGDYSALEFPLIIPFLIAGNVNVGMFMSVNCHEELFTTTPEAILEIYAETPETEAFGILANYGDPAVHQAMCEAWGAAPAVAIDTEPVISDIPSLLLNGQFDPATPPAWGELARANLSNHFYYVFPGLGHAESLSGGCPFEIALQFLSDPTTEPDASCIDEMSVSFVGAAGAEPVTLDIPLVETTDDTIGYTALIPEGWDELAPGTFVNPENQFYTIVVQITPTDNTALLDLLKTQLNQEDLAPFGDPIVANEIEWTPYYVEVQGLIAVYIGLAEVDGSSYLILVQAPLDEAEAAYEALFLPILNSFVAN